MSCPARLHHDNFLAAPGYQGVRSGLAWSQTKRPLDYSDHNLEVLLLSVQLETKVNWKFNIFNSIRIFYSETTQSISHQFSVE